MCIFCLCGRKKDDDNDQRLLETGMTEKSILLPPNVIGKRKKKNNFPAPPVKTGNMEGLNQTEEGLDMAELNRKRLLEIVNRSGNNVCAECGEKVPEWASYNIGVFLCTQCAGYHRNLGTHISKVKSLILDNWENSQVKSLEDMGNLKAKAKYEAYCPVYYRRPCKDDVHVLKEQWVRAKYEREEFIHVDRQVYSSGTMEGTLWKRGKEDGRFQPRRFVLSEADGSIKYYVKESHKEPKAVIPLSELNATFCPEKVRNPNGMQLTYVHDGSTRNIFVYSEDGKSIVDWYLAIRATKLNRLRIAYPGIVELELAHFLTKDFLKEGWLYKTGPRPTDSYKRRWFSLDDRKLMYLVDPLDPYPKGEIFLGYHIDGFAVRKGVPPGLKEQGFGLTLRTRDRVFLLGAETESDCTEWMAVLQSVIERPLTPQDNIINA